MLLKDPRVDVSLAEEFGCTPLWQASFFGHLKVVEWFIASGRDLGDISSQRVEHGDHENNALEIAIELENTRIVSVLRKFMANPERTRHDLRVKLGLQNGLAAEVYALSVFLCDGASSIQASSYHQ